MDLKLVTKYNKNVPRYTSYPTAPHFKTDFDYVKVLNKLQNIKHDEPISLYIHIPFCEILCLYCACNTKIVATQKPIDEYLTYLKKELDILKQQLPKKLTVNNLHFGGGTPTSLSADNFKMLFSWITEVFDIDYSGELSIEIDPRVITNDKIDALADCGINRVSFGVQDFDENVQSVINRVQPFELVRNVVAKLRAKGINSINFDLIYGLPCQTVKTMEKTIELTNDIKPERIALYGYAHVPHMKKHQKILEEYHLPDANERFDIFSKAKQMLTDDQYEFVGIDHFVLKEDSLAQAYHEGLIRRNFQGYTVDTNDNLISIGASAISQSANSYMQNAHDLNQYRKLLDENKLPVIKYLDLTTDDIVRRDIIESILCYFKVNLNTIESKHGLNHNHFATELAMLKPFEDDGIIEINDNILTIKPECKVLVRIIASYFDDYLARVQFTHSSAV